jgi:hypothetical protein
MYFERKDPDSVKAPAILHNIADIPNGVTIKTTGLTPGELPDATPIYPDSEGLYSLVATVKVVETAAANAVNYSVAKGHQFKVGQKIYKDASTNVDISAINTTDATKDVITVSATLGAKAIGANLTQGNLPKAVAITGSPATIEAGKNLFVPAVVIGVVNKNIMPQPDNKPDGIQYV